MVTSITLVALSRFSSRSGRSKEIDPDYVIPMHCSGAGFLRIAQREMPDKLILSYTGSRYIFGA